MQILTYEKVHNFWWTDVSTSEIQQVLTWLKTHPSDFWSVDVKWAISDRFYFDVKIIDDNLAVMFKLAHGGQV